MPDIDEYIRLANFLWYAPLLNIDVIGWLTGGRNEKAT
jgi:hypothetical protein